MAIVNRKSVQYPHPPSMEEQLDEAAARSEAMARKAIPIARGFMDYFPDAIKEIAACSLACNEQHYGKGAPMHWDKTVSTDQADSAMRHFMDRGTLDNDGIRHSTKAAWRMLAYLQLEIEAEKRSEALDELTRLGQEMEFENSLIRMIESIDIEEHFDWGKIEKARALLNKKCVG